jgi:hypothetical protein
MGMTTVEELKEMEQKLAIMEWDIQRDQINPAQRARYQKLKETYERMKVELKPAVEAQVEPEQEAEQTQ